MSAEDVLESLKCHAAGFDEPHSLELWEEHMLMADIVGKLDKGWTEHEIFSILIQTEHVNPYQEEDKALDKMSRIHKAVNSRLGLTDSGNML